MVTRPSQVETVVRFGVFEADLAVGELRRGGHRLRLQEKPFQLLAILLEQPGRVVGKEELQQRLWPDVTVDADGGLNEAVYKLRQALDDSAQAPRYIETVPKRGYRFIAAVETPAVPPPGEVDSRDGHRRWKLAALALGSAAIAAAGTYLLTGPRTTELPQRRFSFPVEKLTVDARTQPVVAISPDGTRLVYGADHALWLQELDQIWNPRKLPGTETSGVSWPAWSPDSRKLAFEKDGQVFSLEVPGGAPKLLAKVPEEGIAGVRWTPNGGSILVSVNRTAKAVKWWEANSAGGELKPANEWPGLPHRPVFFRAAGRHRVLGEGGDLLYRNDVVVWDGPRQEPRRLGFGRMPQYSATGHVVFQAHDENFGIWGLSFSLERAEPRGEAFPIVPRGRSPSVSADGALVYAVVPEEYDQLLLLNRRGETIRLIGDRQREIAYPSFSPDAKRVAVWGFEYATNTDWMADIWIHEVDRPLKTRLTEHPRMDLYPQWTPDGRMISFSSDRTNSRDIYLQSAASSRAAERLWGGQDFAGWLSDWSSDGQNALIWGGAPDDEPDLWIFDRETRTAKPLSATHFRDEAGAFSPDARYVAFTSNRSGKREVYVCAAASCAENIRQISTNGGYQIRWKDDGSLYYVEGHNRMMMTPIATEPELTIGEPVFLFESEHLWLPGSGRVSFYDVTEDGEQFVVVESARARTTKEMPGVIHVWQNWAAAFEDKE